jgi:hypothetical protein
MSIIYSHNVLLDSILVNNTGNWAQSCGFAYQEQLKQFTDYIATQPTPTERIPSGRLTLRLTTGPFTTETTVCR